MFYKIKSSVFMVIFRRRTTLFLCVKSILLQDSSECIICYRWSSNIYIVFIYNLEWRVFVFEANIYRNICSKTSFLTEVGKIRASIMTLLLILKNICCFFFHVHINFKDLTTLLNPYSTWEYLIFIW